MAETKSKRQYIIRTLPLIVVAFAGDMISIFLRLNFAQRPDIPLFVKSAMGYLPDFWNPLFVLQLTAFAALIKSVSEYQNKIRFNSIFIPAIFSIAEAGLPIVGPMVGYYGPGTGKFDWRDIVAYCLAGLTNYLLHRHLVVSKKSQILSV
jgi:hypothetical protein